MYIFKWPIITVSWYFLFSLFWNYHQADTVLYSEILELEIEKLGRGNNIAT